jgi:hypothetical protein
MNVVGLDNSQDSLESRLFKPKEETFVEKTCHQVDELMKKMSLSKQDSRQYDLKMHLANLTEDEKNNLKELTEQVSSLLKFDQDLFFADGEKVQKIIDQALFPEVQPALDEKLLEKAKILEDDLTLLTKVFNLIVEALNIEIKSMKSNAAFNSFKSPIVSYYNTYNQHAEVFSLVKNNYKKVIEDLEIRVQKDEEENNYNSPYSFWNDPVKVKKDTLDTLEHLYSMAEGQATKNISDLHLKTEEISKFESVLKDKFEEHKKIKRLCKRAFCHLIYLYVKQRRPGSYYDNFSKEYDWRGPGGEKKVHYLKQTLAEISEQLSTNKEI